MSNGANNDSIISACATCEHGPLLATFVDFVQDTHASFKNLEDGHEKLRVGIYDAEASGTSPELQAVKADAVASMSSVLVRLTEIDLLMEAVADMRCADQVSDRCPKIDAILDFKFGE